MTAPLVCPQCRASLAPSSDGLGCARCELSFPVEDGLVDFSQGSYYDAFAGDEATLSACQACGLANEETGVRARIEDYYLPAILAFQDRAELGRPVRVLDSGCGNGLSVDLLNAAGFEAWGNDISALRKWQWRERDRRDRLVVADTLALPFPDGYFDVVLSSGVIEHIGVDERGGEEYWVAPRPDRDERRLEFLGELLRVTSRDGVFCLDCPNGAFPIDFWHGTVPGGARFHSLSEGFLPKVREIRSYLRNFGEHRIVARSPRTRLRMKQVGRHLYGRLLRLPMVGLLRLMEVPGFRGLAASPLNPYLVLEITPRH